MNTNIKILFLTTLRQVEIAYPLLRWRKDLRNAGFDITVASKWNWSESSMFDLVIFSNPYFSSLSKKSDGKPKEALAREIKMANSFCNKIALFDTRDNCYTNYLDILPKIDLLLKKQIFFDKRYYLNQKNAPNFSNESANFALSNNIDLNKIQVGWNVAFNDFSKYRKYAKILHWLGIFYPMKYARPEKYRPYLSSFRGGLINKRFHRQRAIDNLKELRNKNVKLGKPISKSAYLRELENSRTLVSPFGHGEVCYRDFEAFISGSCLIKPNMNHLKTFPDIYKPWETFIPVEWDFSDLHKILKDPKHNHTKFSDIASKGQITYKEYCESSTYFIDHFRELIGKII